MSQLFNVYALNLKDYSRRPIANGVTEANADGIVNMAVMRRGVEDEIFVSEPVETQMRAFAKEAVRMAWQPVEAAPRSAEPILVFNQSGRMAIETGHYLHNMMHAAKIDGEECYFTHWMPLPTPPAALKEET